MLRFPLLRETGTRMSHDWSYRFRIDRRDIDGIEKWKTSSTFFSFPTISKIRPLSRISVLIGKRDDLSPRAASYRYTRRRWGGIFFQDTMETRVSVTWEERRRGH